MAWSTVHRFTSPIGSENYEPMAMHDAGKPPWAMHPERRSIARHAQVVAWNRPPHHHKRVCTAGKTGVSLLSALLLR